MICLVTGGWGFIGTHIVSRLLEDGHKVIILDNGSTSEPKKNRHYRATTYGGYDINGYKSNLGILKQEKVDVVFHLAARPRVQFSIDEPEMAHRANIDGTFTLLLACKDAGIKRFVYSSSSSVYGDQDVSPLVETLNPNPMSPYALQKLVGEYYCKLFYQLYGLETVSLRYFNVYGPGQKADSSYAALIPLFSEMFIKGQAPGINGDGEQTRDFTYIDDIVEANMKATYAYPSCFGEAFNIGAGNSKSVNEVSAKLKELSGSVITPFHRPPVVEPKRTLADISKAKKLLEWEPSVPFEEGIEKTFAYFSSACETSPCMSTAD